MTYTANTNLMVASSYLAKGFMPIPIKPASKKPVLTDWNNLEVNESNIANLFSNDNLNVGIVLGTASNGLVDIDLDDPDAIRFAKRFLPPTDAVFGHESNPTSHWLYLVPEAKSTKQFKTEGLGTIAEIRGNHCLTVFPGSIHETGEPIRFESDGEPGETTWDELVRSATKTSIATVAFKSWTPGNRHSLALALSGFLTCARWLEHDISAVIEAICDEAGDEEISDRLLCVSTTVEKHKSGHPVAWKSGLATLLGEKTVNALERWVPKAISNPTGAPPMALGSFEAMTDTSLSNAFADAYKSDLIWAAGNWYRREGDIYRAADAVVVQGMAKQFLQERFQSYGPYCKAVFSRNRINATVELSRHHFFADSSSFNTDRNLLGLADGRVLDLERQTTTGENETIVTKASGVTFNPKSQCPRWLQFLNRIFEGDQEIISFLKRAVGYSLTGYVREHALFVLIGKGANGKSTFTQTLLHLLGDYGATIPMQTLMNQGRASTQTNDLASIQGTRFVVASEGERDQKLAESKIKFMTGGDRIKCRGLYKDFIEFDPTFKIWMTTNNLPSASGSDDAIWRRIMVIEFPVSIPKNEQDPDLGNALLSELPGILNWALEGHREWVEKKLLPPEKVLASTHRYQEENDVVGQWMSSCCSTENVAATTPVKLLHESYAEWCNNSGLETLSPNIFGKELTRKGFATVKKNKGNRRKGIALVNFPES